MRRRFIPPLKLRKKVGTYADRVYQAKGERILQFLIENCNLQPHETILDVGCGCGRVAVPLTSYIDSSGRYEGFDVDPSLIDWCKNHITAQFPNFRFRRVNILNGSYNPKGRVKAADYAFPYPEAHFHIACANAVFSHMLAPAVNRYFREIRRVLKPGGICFSTFFLTKNGKQTRGGIFTARRGICEIADPMAPEATVGYPFAFIKELHARSGLVIEKVIRGSWHDARFEIDHPFQDVIIGRKRA